MKILVILSLIVLVSCSPTEVPSEKLVERGGITYLINSQTPFSGRSVSYYENGQVKGKINYKNGKPDGFFEHYYENGQLNIKGNQKDGEPDGLWESYYDNGQLMIKVNYNKDGKEDGLWESYYENGQLTIKGNYKDGKEDGLWR